MAFPNIRFSIEVDVPKKGLSRNRAPRPQIPLGHLDGGVARQELNLLEVSTGLAAELGAGPSAYMGGASLSTSPVCRAYYINSVTVQGFVGADATSNKLDGGRTVLNFTVATSRFRGEGDNREQFIEWHKIAACGKVASTIGSVAKGAHVKVEGELRIREYTTETGKVQTYAIVASEIEVLDKEEAAA